MNPLTALRRRLGKDPAAGQGRQFQNAPAQRHLEEQLARAKGVLDLGSGPNPVAGATAAVDLFLGADQRSHGAGGSIDPAALATRGVRFVNQSIDQPLPFADGEFGFVYSSHVIEHVDNPGRACDEMMRVGKTGLVRCPSAMAEYMYGREYHRWLVLQRGGRLVFVEKTRDEHGLFGSSQAREAATINPFEALLDWAGEQPSTGSNRIIARLRSRLQGLFYGRAPQSEVNLFWEGGFRWVELRCDGTVRQGGRPGQQHAFTEAGERQDFAAGAAP
ncbi:MAG: methyltransferase domain-containing protein [Planctomycetes bacterium]|nr:methyltransferase domain-containing protein [Planctomycetota bacterium]